MDWLKMFRGERGGIGHNKWGNWEMQLSRKGEEGHGLAWGLGQEGHRGLRLLGGRSQGGARRWDWEQGQGAGPRLRGGAGSQGKGPRLLDGGHSQGVVPQLRGRLPQRSHGRGRSQGSGPQLQGGGA